MGLLAYRPEEYSHATESHQYRHLLQTLKAFMAVWDR